MGNDTLPPYTPSTPSPRYSEQYLEYCHKVRGWHLECFLFIPSVQTYAFSNTITFHLQIRGSSASLAPFFEQDYDAHQGATGQRNSHQSISAPTIQRENMPQRAATSGSRGKWILHNPYFQDIARFYGILSGKAWILSIRTGYLDAAKMSHQPNFRQGLYHSVNHSSATTQITTVGCNTFLS